MNIQKYKAFLLKKGYTLDSPILYGIVKPLEEFLKDNPVPSLDTLLKEFQKTVRMGKKDSFNTPEAYNEFLKHKLQNGVETKKN